MSGFFVQSFGCRATQADGAALERQLAAQGLSQAGSAREADLVVLNTCTVTAAADQDARASIRRIHRENPAAKIMVTGCYAQRAPQEIAALPGVTWVVGNSHKHRVAEIAAGAGFEAELQAQAMMNIPASMAWRACDDESGRRILSLWKPSRSLLRPSLS